MISRKLTEEGVVAGAITGGILISPYYGLEYAPANELLFYYITGILFFFIMGLVHFIDRNLLRKEKLKKGHEVDGNVTREME